MLRNIKNYIDYNYGSRRGLLNHCKFAFHHRLGVFSQYVRVDWGQVGRLVFVCHGNICRSPVAEIVAKSERIDAISYGLHCRDGAEANPRAIEFARSIGLSLSNHRTCNIRHYQPLSSDLVVVMEPIHLSALGSFTSDGPQITLAGLWLDAPNPYLHDPYNADDRFFALCESRIASSVKKLSENLVLAKRSLA